MGDYLYVKVTQLHQMGSETPELVIEALGLVNREKRRIFGLHFPVSLSIPLQSGM
jgi:hypothetical protein